MSVCGIVLAAGAATRFGAAKQFATIGGERLVDRAVATARVACDSLVLVLPHGVAWGGPPVDAVIAGGATRLESSRNGLEAVPQEASIVVVHDAAHPLAPVGMFRELIAAVERGAEAALAVLPATDTVMRVVEDRAQETLAREGLVSVQIPQVFRADVLRAAHARGEMASDESVLMQRMGARIAFVPGNPGNVHVTTPEELAMAEQLAARLAFDGVVER